jgi:hypothetical protein
VPLLVMAEPVVYLSNSDFLVEEDVLIIQTSFHDIKLRKLEIFSASYD